LYTRGMQAIQAKRPQEAYQFFLAAYQSGERLDDRKTRYINDYLSTHAPVKSKRIQLAGTRPAAEENILDGPADQESPRRIDAVDQRRQVSLEKLRTEVLNTTFRAEGLAEKNPQHAVELLDRAQSGVENSGFDGETVRPLLARLAQSRKNVEY